MRESLIGAIRSRNLKYLTSASSLFDVHKHNVDTLRALMQVEAFFKKNANFESGEAAEKAALASFHEAECTCALTNQRLETFFLEPERFSSDLQIKIERMRKFIHRVMGPFAAFRKEIPMRCRVTPGATSTNGRRDSLPHLKLKKRLVAPYGAFKYLQALSDAFGYGELRLVWSNINRVEMVLKNWKTRRIIGCEAEGALPLQLAFDSFAKDRLRTIGIDLSDQTWNQRLAYAGSMADDLATVDLRQASDLTAFNAIALLFELEWFHFLADIRAQGYRLPTGERGVYEKFSSMGNGCTFTLETLIFRAACEAVGSTVNAVYGDDIVIESCLAQELIDLLAVFGFRPNVDKTFIRGPFRESCGVNYYKGIDVTPFYIRELSATKANKSVFVNGLASIAIPEGRLAALLKGLVAKWQLRLVPWTEDAGAGVHVDASTAYAKGLIRNRKGMLEYKAYVSKDTSRRVTDYRTYSLWFFEKLKTMEAPVPRHRLDIGRRIERIDLNARLFHRWLVTSRGNHWSSTNTTEVPLLTHKYVSKWVPWFPPRQVPPIMLFAWSDYLTA
jgi:hypothetical protein